MSAMPGTRASAPIIPATASIAFPMTQPTTIATSAAGSDSAGTRIAPATMTSSETPRFPHSSPVSSPLSTCSRGGTGSMPQLPSTVSGLRHRRVRLDDGGVIPRYYVVAEATHEIQNPTSREKLLLLGERLGLGPGLARARHRLRAAEGRRSSSPRRSAAACTGSRSRRSSMRSPSSGPRRRGSPSGSRSSSVTGQARRSSPSRTTPRSASVRASSTASLADTVDALAPAVRPGGHVVVGEPYWRRLPLPGGLRGPCASRGRRSRARS